MALTVPPPVNPADEPVPFSLTKKALAVVPPAARSWVRQIWTGGQVVETCPSWCTSTHANDTNGCLDDLVHSTTDVATRVEMHLAGTDGPAAWPVLSASIRQHPYSSKPEMRAPHVTFEAAPDDIIEVLDPDEFAAVIDQLAAHVDRLRAVHAQLVELRGPVVDDVPGLPVPPPVEPKGCGR